MKGLIKFLFLLISTTVLAEEIQTLDSLNALIQDGAINDTLKVEAYIHLASLHLDASPDKSMENCKQAYAFSSKINYSKGILKACGWIAYLYEQFGEIDSAIYYNQKALVLAKKLSKLNDQAAIINNLAAIYKNQGKIDQALLLHQQGLKLRLLLKDKSGVATVFNNRALIFSNQGKIPLALNDFSLALRMYELLNDWDGVATVLQNIGAVYKEQNDYAKALEYYKRALAINIQSGDNYSIAYSYGAIGNLFEKKLELDSALTYHHKSMTIRKSIDDKQGLSYSLLNIGRVQNLLGNTDTAQSYFEQSLRGFESLGDKWGMASVTNLLGGLFLKIGALKPAENYLLRSMKLSRELGYPTEIRNAAGNLQLLYRHQNNWLEALRMNDLYIEMRDSVLNDNNRKAYLTNQFQYDYSLKENLLKSEQEKKDALGRAEIAKQKLVRNGFIGGFIIVLLFALVFFSQRNKIRDGKKLSDALLLNILPEEIAEELKNKGTSEARQIDSVTVLFTDFKGFTQLSEKLSPKELVAEIDACFSEFDNIMNKHGVEKIKTIGDAYMAAGGIPKPNQTHAKDVVMAALEIRDFMLNRNRQMTTKDKKIEKMLEIRIGIHTGPVVAGIVGSKKYSYDIWGDTVNTASRMESSGEPGQINISGSTYEIIKDKFVCNYRGKIAAKNKGAIDMYFVEGNRSYTSSSEIVYS